MRVKQLNTVSYYCGDSSKYYCAVCGEGRPVTMGMWGNHIITCDKCETYIFTTSEEGGREACVKKWNAYQRKVWHAIHFKEFNIEDKNILEELIANPYVLFEKKMKCKLKADKIQVFYDKEVGRVKCKVDTDIRFYNFTNIDLPEEHPMPEDFKQVWRNTGKKIAI